MKNLLSKTLLCGVLASAFLLVNCQKAPNRDVKPKVDPITKPQAKVGVCTADVVAANDKFIKDLNELKDKLAKATDADKEVLRTLANALNVQAKIVLAKMAEIKVGAADEVGKEKVDPKAKPPVVAEACVVHQDNDAKKPATGAKVQNLIIKQSRSEIGKAVKAKTGVGNDITDGEDLADAGTLKEKDQLKLAKALADVLSKDDSTRGVVAIVKGNVKEKTDAEEALKNPGTTACAVSFSNKANTAVAEGTVATITSLALSKNDKQSILSVGIAIKLGEDQSLGMLTCNIAAEKKDEAAAKTEARAALGDLVKPAAAGSEDVVLKEETPAADASTSDSTTADSAAKKATAERAKEALKALTDAEARKQ